MMHFNTQSGFSLVETLVAITILLIVIVGPMTITTSAARSTSFASEQVTAFFLAQEGAELVQKVRDDLILEGGSDPWGDFTDTSSSGILEDCYDSSGCGLAVTDTSDGQVSMVNCSGNNCRLFYENDPTAGRVNYTHSNSGTASSTVYTRVIRLDETSPGQVSVESVVTWQSGNFRSTQSARVETYLFEIYGP